MANTNGMMRPMTALRDITYGGKSVAAGEVFDAFGLAQANELAAAGDAEHGDLTEGPGWKLPTRVTASEPVAEQKTTEPSDEGGEPGDEDGDPQEGTQTGAGDEETGAEGTGTETGDEAPTDSTDAPKDDTPTEAPAPAPAPAAAPKPTATKRKRR